MIRHALENNAYATRIDLCHVNRFNLNSTEIDCSVVDGGYPLDLEKNVDHYVHYYGILLSFDLKFPTLFLPFSLALHG